MSEAVARRTSRGVSVIMCLLAAYYAVFGGEYDLADVRELRAEHAAQLARLDSLEAVLDSVGIWADSLVSSPRVIERVAREKHSFIRPGELLFLFVEREAEDGPQGG